MGARVKDIDPVINPQQRFSSQREAIVLKSDVWRSKDGNVWELVTPGCHAPQSNLVAKGNTHDNKFGTVEFSCNSAADCYGDEFCDPERKVYV
jgi:hypothetical protein